MRNRAHGLLGWMGLAWLFACDPASYGGRLLSQLPPMEGETVPADFESFLSVWSYQSWRLWTTESRVPVPRLSAGQFDVWSVLAGQGDADLQRSYGQPYPGRGRLSVGSWAKAGLGREYLLVVSTLAHTVPFFGSAGPATHVRPGAQLLHRICTPEGGTDLEEVPFGTVLPFDGPSPEGMVLCQPLPLPTFDLGQPMAALPTMTPDPNRWDLPNSSVQSLVWAPQGQEIYFNDAAVNPSIYRFRLASGAVSLVAGSPSAEKGTLAIGTDGTTLLLFVDRSYGASTIRQFELGETASSFFRDFSQSVASPDGQLLADLSGARLTLVDLQTGQTRTEALPSDCSSRCSGTALAFSPDGTKLLSEGCISHDSVGAPSVNLVSVSLKAGTCSNPWPTAHLDLWTGTAATKGTPGATDRTVSFSWTASGPKALIQEPTGTHLYDVATQKTATLVPAERVPPPFAPFSFHVGLEQVFTWSMQCQGLAETNCAANLLRTSLVDGTQDVVLTAPVFLPFAVSPDGTTIVTADKERLYLKSITARPMP